MAQLHLFSQNLKANFQTATGWIAKTATLGKFVALVPLVVFGSLIVQELMRDVVTIEPIEVPKALSDKGYTPGVAGYRLRDALNAYAEELSRGIRHQPQLEFGFGCSRRCQPQFEFGFDYCCAQQTTGYRGPANRPFSSCDCIFHP